MAFEPGDVVLKSGGQPMTVANVSGEQIECIWIGEEGVFFRENLPAVTLLSVEGAEMQMGEEEEEEDEEEDEDDEDQEDEDEEDEDEKEEDEKVVEEQRA